MINLSIVNPLELPSVPLLDRKKLHRWGGVYFVIRGEKDILYIGQSPLIKNRWNQHHLLRKLSEDDKQQSRIYWLATDEDLEPIEAAFIHHFRPPLNRYYPPIHSAEVVTPPKTLQVKRVVEVVHDFPELGKRIKAARERDDRPLSQICRDCGISRSYWYQLESEDLRSPATEEMIRKIEQALGINLEVSFND
ncbi:helix-turn-helix domain protein [Crinalium epipsammum PCC 9333]|uniref:Helix-turn-helix domain protein n=1 Tax=Crinalium epipsammum PCC 9333 TaxID=1173022 RepID=K9VTP8_9CYAN|nr:helix-turn-helix domain-containing protein [Crinalium epipsammum]AFZ11326.1 helix-turn-helix domain protein [Crinalium epipsammum PCC 9333]